jgi:serine/threonine-protein kinase TTK/MPS1
MSMSPSTSPPRTPEDNRTSSKSMTPNSDDSSIIDDLSFDYIIDSEGNLVRLSKGSSSKSNHSSPPTPQEASLQPDLPLIKPPPSPDLLNSPVSRISFSRSESAFPVLSSGSSSGPQNEKPARSFQRVASGPAISMSTSNLAPTSASLSNPRAASRRIGIEDGKDFHEVNSSSRSRQTVESNSPAYLSNGASTASGRPLTDIQRSTRSRQIMPGPNRAGRIMKSASVTKYNGSGVHPSFDRISERETSDNEQADYYSPVQLAVNGDDTDLEDEPVVVVDPAAIPLPSGPHISGGRQRGQSFLNANVNVNGLSAGSTAALTLSGNRPRRSASLSDALCKFL